MNSKQQRQFLEDMLNQMPELNSEHKVYRKELDEKLARARREEKSMRWIVIGASAGTVIFYIAAGFLSYRFGGAHGRLPEWFWLLAAAVVLLVPVGSLLLLGLYFFKYRRLVNRAQAKTQQAALGELQRQLNELRAQLLPSNEKQPPPPPQK